MGHGEMFTNVADLAIPFGLLFALRAFQNKTKEAPKRKRSLKLKPKTKQIKKGGECSVCSQSVTPQLGGTREIIREEILKITQDLKNLLSM